LGLREIDLALYAASAIAEMVGVVVTIIDLSSASKRLLDFLRTEPPFIVTASPSGRQQSNETATAVPPTIAQRVNALETWKAKELPTELDQLDRDIRRTIAIVTQNSYDTFMGRWRQLKGYVRSGHQHWLRRYLGPVLIGLGIALGFVGNLVNIYALSAH
jgi:hypothetical protein